MDVEIISELKQRLTGQSIVLDIGFGTGRISFDILSEVAPGKIIGVESRKKEEIERDYNSFLGPEFDKGIYELRKSDGEIDLYEYYKYLATGNNNKSLDLESFTNKVNINFNKTFQNFIRNNKDHFDLIILFNVLHYSRIGEPRLVLSELKNILTENGLILISFKKYKHSNGGTNSDRQEIDVPSIVGYLSASFKTIIIKNCDVENSIIYLGERYAPQQKI